MALQKYLFFFYKGTLNDSFRYCQHIRDVYIDERSLSMDFCWKRKESFWNFLPCFSEWISIYSTFHSRVKQVNLNNWFRKLLSLHQQLTTSTLQLTLGNGNFRSWPSGTDFSSATFTLCAFVFSLSMHLTVLPEYAKKILV